MTATVIRNGRIVTAVDDYTADILMEDGRVRMIGTDLPVGEGVAEHDAAGLLVLPGGVDVHTHLDWDFGPARTADTFYTGSQAAAFGGTTTVVDFAAQVKGTSPLAGLADWHERASVAAVDMGAHMIVTEVNDQTLIDMKSLIHDEGVSTFKLFTAYPDVLMIDDGQIFKTMRQVGAHGGMVQIHAENGHVIDVLVQEALDAGNTSPKWHMLTRPTLMEGEATHRVIRIAELAEAPVYIVHLSAGEALDAVTEARDRGLPVHAETCPHYLFLTDEEYERPGFEGAKFVMTPPLRGCCASARALARAQDRRPAGHRHRPLPVLLQRERAGPAPLQGSWPRRLQQDPQRRAWPRDPHAAGLRRRRPPQRDVAQPLRGADGDRAPAKLFGLFPRKGTIAVGSDADIVLFDPNETWTVRAAEHHSRVEYSLFEGREVTGRVNKVFLRGELIVDGREWLGREGGGQFLKRGQAGKAK